MRREAESPSRSMIPDIPLPGSCITGRCEVANERPTVGNVPAMNMPGQTPVVVVNNTPQPCCPAPQQTQPQPIIINNIIPAGLLAQAQQQQQQQQAQQQPVINVTLPPQPAPQVNLSLPEIQPTFNVNLSPNGANSSNGGNGGGGGNGGNGASGGNGGNGSNNANSVQPSNIQPSSAQATSTAQPNSNTTPNAVSPQTISREEADKLQKQIDELRVLMPLYDEATKQVPQPEKPVPESTTKMPTFYNGSEKCCLPNIFLNVSPHFNQQLQASDRDYTTSGAQQTQRQPAYYEAYHSGYNGREVQNARRRFETQEPRNQAIERAQAEQARREYYGVPVMMQPTTRTELQPYGVPVVIPAERVRESRDVVPVPIFAVQPAALPPSSTTTNSTANTSNTAYTERQEERREMQPPKETTKHCDDCDDDDEEEFEFHLNDRFRSQRYAREFI